MKVNGTGSYEAVRAYFNQVKKEKEKSAPAAREGRADRVELSPAAQKLVEYTAALRELPDVRSKLVEELRREVSAGTYRPDAGKIAEGIMKERALEKEALAVREVRDGGK